MKHELSSRLPRFRGKTVGRVAGCALGGVLLATMGCGGGAGSNRGVPDAAGGGATGADSGGLDGGRDGSDDGAVADAAGTPGPGGAAEIACRELTAPASGLCSVTPGSSGLLLRGTVLAPGKIYRGGEVAVDSAGVITCVGCDCPAPDATTVSCARGVISPGLINTHDHITFAQNGPAAGTTERYEHRHDWRVGKRGHTPIASAGSATPDEVLWAELRFVLGGATSTVGSGGAAGLLRNLDRSTLQEGLALPAVLFDTFPLGDSNGTQLMSGCAYPNIKKSESLAAVPSYLAHMAEGIDAVAHNEFVCMSPTSVAAGGQDLVKSQTAILHGIALTASDLGAIAAAGAKLVWSPRSDVARYGDTAPVTVAARLGVPIALGTDWIVSGSMNLLRELKCADSLNAGAYQRFFSDEDLWRMVTGDAALVAAAGERLGALAAGRLADMTIFDGTTHQTFRAVIAAEPADVALVLRGGKTLYGDAAVVDGLAAGCDAVDVCGTSKRVCAMAETGRTYETLQASGGARYPAFVCGAPMNEPTCTPQRPTAVNGSSVYTGAPGSADQDGDGVADMVDTCPGLFNPIRPLDNGTQADHDGDGLGDGCDPCPLAAHVTVCPTPRN